MLPSNPFAFKEWAAICAALGAGRQAIIVRKGGIHEGSKGFRVAHGEFWLFPTLFHEAEQKLTDEAGPFLEQVAREQRVPGTIPLAQYAVVTDVIEVRDEALLRNLDGLQLWSPRTLSERFQYREPGLFVLVVRIFNRTPPLVVPDSPHFAGCRTWVELPAPLATAELQPALSDPDYERLRDQVLRALPPVRTA